MPVFAPVRLVVWLVFRPPRAVVSVAQGRQDCMKLGLYRWTAATSILPAAEEPTLPS